MTAHVECLHELMIACPNRRVRPAAPSIVELAFGFLTLHRSATDAGDAAPPLLPLLVPADALAADVLADAVPLGKAPPPPIVTLSELAANGAALLNAAAIAPSPGAARFEIGGPGKTY